MNTIKSNKFDATSIYFYNTRSKGLTKFDDEYDMFKWIAYSVKQIENSQGPKNKIREINNMFDVIRQNKEIFNLRLFNVLREKIRLRILDIRNKDNIDRLTNEWHFWLFDTNIVD